MTFPTHCLGGAAAIALLDTVLPSFTADKTMFIVGTIAAALPDLDYSRSFIGRIFYPISTTIETHTGHRTATHSILVCTIVSTLLGWPLSLFLDGTLLMWAVIVGAGYGSHIILDWFTREGAQSYWPAQVWCVLPKNRSWRIRTGSSGEWFFVALLTAFFAVTFQPSREAVAVWFRSSFIQEKVEEFHRFELKRQQITGGKTLAEIDSLTTAGILTPLERKEMLYELEQLSINERITRRMYGLPDTSSTGRETHK